MIYRVLEFMLNTTKQYEKHRWFTCIEIENRTSSVTNLPIQPCWTAKTTTKLWRNRYQYTIVTTRCRWQFFKSLWMFLTCSVEHLDLQSEVWMRFSGPLWCQDALLRHTQRLALRCIKLRKHLLPVKRRRFTTFTSLGEIHSLSGCAAIEHRVIIAEEGHTKDPNLMTKNLRWKGNF